MAIEILQNTLLKLIVRQGTDATRQNVILDSGEVGYSTDTKRLFVGDGTTYGGVLVGNVFQGTNTPVTYFNTSQINDLAFDTSTNKLYRLQFSDASDINNWEVIGGVYEAADSSITLNADNTFKVNVNALSGFTITPLYARYDGSTATLTYSKNVNSVTKSGTGYYIFNYSIGSSNVIPYVQIYGTSQLHYQPRVTFLTNTQCHVQVTNLSGGLIDADIFFSIIQ